jgi:hypothetical protein
MTPMYQVDCLLEWSDEGRAEARTPLDGLACIESLAGGHKMTVRALDLSESGLAFSSSRAPKVGEQLRIEVGGFLLEVVVRNVRKEMCGYRVGTENL